MPSPVRNYKETFAHYRQPERAAHYARLYARSGPLDFERALLERFLPGGGRVLVLGGGTGREIAGLPPSAEAVCLDQSWLMLKQAGSPAAGRKTPSAVAADGAELPFADGSFDAALVFNVLHTLVQGRDAENPHVRLLAEARRALKPSGRLLLWVRLAPWPAVQAALSLLFLPRRLAAAFRGDDARWKTLAFHPDPFTHEPWTIAKTPLQAAAREARMFARHAVRALRHLPALAENAARAAGNGPLYPRDCCFRGQWGHFFTFAELDDVLRRAGLRRTWLGSDWELVTGRPLPFAARAAFFACAAAEPA